MDDDNVIGENISDCVDTYIVAKANAKARKAGGRQIARAFIDKPQRFVKLISESETEHGQQYQRTNCKIAKRTRATESKSATIAKSI